MGLRGGWGGEMKEEGRIEYIHSFYSLEKYIAISTSHVHTCIGTCTPCRHNFRHNRRLKHSIFSSIISKTMYACCNESTFTSAAQLAEHWTRNAVVSGSNPICGSSGSFPRLPWPCALVLRGNNELSASTCVV